MIQELHRLRQQQVNDAVGGAPTIEVLGSSASTWVTSITSPQTESHTCTSGTKLLVVQVVLNDAVEATATISGITYNSVSMTEATQGWDTDSGVGLAQYYLVSPPTGSSYNIEVSFGAGTASGFLVYAVDLDTDETSLSVDAFNSNAVVSGSPTVDVTTVDADTLILETMYSKQSLGTALTVGTGQTELYKDDTGAQTSGTSYKVVSSAAAHTMYWTDTQDDENCRSLAVSYKSS